MFEGDAPHPNVPKWNVKVLTVSRTRRHLDAGVVNKFWELVERDIVIKKPYLLPKPAAGGAAAAAGAGAGAGAATAAAR